MLKLRSNKVLFRSLCVFMAFVMAFPALATGLPAAASDFRLLIHRLTGERPPQFSKPPRQRPHRQTERRDSERSRWWTTQAEQAYEQALLNTRGDGQGGMEFSRYLVATTIPGFALAWGSGSTAGYPIPGEGSFPGGGSGKANELGLTGVVNSNTANLTLRWPIVSFPTRGGMNVDLTFFHNSQSSAVSGDLGPGWTHSYNMNIVWTMSYAFVEMPDGLVVPFADNGPGYDSPPGFYGTLEDTMTGRKLTMRDQTVYEFTTYSSIQWLTSISDRLGNSNTLSRTMGGQLTTVTAADGSRTLDFYYSGGVLDHVDGPGSKTWTFGYDGSTRLDTVTFPAPLGKTREVALVYDGNDNVTDEVDANGETWNWTYATDDIAGWSDPGTYAAGATFSFSAPDATMALAGSGNWVHTYDSGYLWLVTDPNNYYNEYNFYDTAVAKPTAVFDKRGKVTVYAYNAMGQVTDRTTDLGHLWQYSYTTLNDIDVITPPVTGEYIDYDYNGDGQLELITQSVDATPTHREVIEIHYDSFKQVDYTLDALKRTTDYAYNGNGDLEEVTTPDGATRFFDYEAYGRLTDSSDNASNLTTRAYDETGWLVYVENPDSTYTEFEYDNNGNRIEFRDERFRSQFWEYDESGRMIKYTNGRGDENLYTYYEPGWVQTHENGNGTTWSYTYTDRGDLYSLDHPDSGIEAWVHDEDGRLAEHTQEITYGVGSVQYGYDDDGLLETIDYPTYAADVAFTYDAAGRRDTMVDGQGTTDWDYDLAGQVISLDTPQGDLTYTYNADGTRDTMTEGGLYTTSYAWDGATGQLNSITNRFSETTTYGYDPTLGTLDTKILDSGQFEEYRYDSRYRLDRVRLYDNTITLLHETEYEFNEASEVESSVIDTVQTDYTYDGASQILTEVRSGYNCTYTYDDNGNRLSKTITGGIAETYNYNSAELLTSVTWNGGSNYKNYTYDSAGRRIQENNTGTSRYFAYDEESRLTAISGAYSATYDYNGLDTRVEKTEASVTRSFMRDGVDVTSPVLNDGAAAYTPGISERRSSTTTYMHSGLKNADYQTDTSQLLVADRTYDAFGNLTGSYGTWQGPFGYAGQFGYQEDGSGLKLLGHRYYDPTIGRFLTRDPAKDGTNWYAYCENNPVTGADPEGRWIQYVLAGVVIIGLSLWGWNNDFPMWDFRGRKIKRWEKRYAADEEPVDNEPSPGGGTPKDPDEEFMEDFRADVNEARDIINEQAEDMYGSGLAAQGLTPGLTGVIGPQIGIDADDLEIIFEILDKVKSAAKFDVGGSSGASANGGGSRY